MERSLLNKYMILSIEGEVNHFGETYFPAAPYQNLFAEEGKNSVLIGQMLKFQLPFS